MSITNQDFKFNKDTKQYNILVEETVNEIEIKVVPNDSKATVTVQNNTDLKPGLNKVTVQVTAENGSVNEYLINVYKMGEEPKKEEPVQIEEPVKDEPKEEPVKESTFNIWIIIAGIELIVIIVLLILLLKKKKDNNSENDYKNTDNTLNEKPVNIEPVSTNNVNTVSNASVNTNTNVNPFDSLATGSVNVEPVEKKEIDIDETI